MTERPNQRERNQRERNQREYIQRRVQIASTEPVYWLDCGFYLLPVTPSRLALYGLNPLTIETVDPCGVCPHSRLPCSSPKPNALTTKTPSPLQLPISLSYPPNVSTTNLYYWLFHEFL